MKRRFKKSVDDPYRTWVKTLPCLIAGRSYFGRNGGEYVHKCEGPIDPHHTTSKGAGGHDRTCVPLCRLAHTMLDSPGWGKKTFATRYGIDWDAEVELCQAKYLTLHPDVSTLPSCE